MPRPRKYDSWRVITFKVPLEELYLISALDYYAELNKTSRTDVILKAIREFLKNHGLFKEQTSLVEYIDWNRRGLRVLIAQIGKRLLKKVKVTYWRGIPEKRVRWTTIVHEVNKEIKDKKLTHEVSLRVVKWLNNHGVKLIIDDLETYRIARKCV
ncbi:MAG: hypothetical protein DRP01_01705 [Archaeoglobales archaeon]|nr:MAG: hypothetical protein DRP01_01705 [Archaeoglobales archaeon]